jgi:hypothetical protein
MSRCLVPLSSVIVMWGTKEGQQALAEDFAQQSCSKHNANANYNHNHSHSHKNKNNKSGLTSRAYVPMRCEQECVTITPIGDNNSTSYVCKRCPIRKCPGPKFNELLSNWTGHWMEGGCSLCEVTTMSISYPLGTLQCPYIITLLRLCSTRHDWYGQADRQTDGASPLSFPLAS